MTELRYDEEGNLIVPSEENELNPEDKEEFIKNGKILEENLNKTNYEIAIKEIKNFQNTFPIERVRDLSLSEYCEGFPKSFCNWVDRETKDAARIHHQGFNIEFGVWFNKKLNKFFIASNVGKKEVDKNTAGYKLEDLKHLILEILSYAKNKEFRKIDEIKMPRHQAKMKMVYLYYPDLIIPIISKEQIKYICERFNIKYESDYPLTSNHNLLEKIRKIDYFKQWDAQKIAILLYYIFPDLKNLKKHKLKYRYAFIE